MTSRLGTGMLLTFFLYSAYGQRSKTVRNQRLKPCVLGESAEQNSAHIPPAGGFLPLYSHAKINCTPRINVILHVGCKYVTLSSIRSPPQVWCMFFLSTSNFELRIYTNLYYLYTVLSSFFTQLIRCQI